MNILQLGLANLLYTGWSDTADRWGGSYINSFTFFEVGVVKAEHSHSQNVKMFMRLKSGTSTDRFGTREMPVVAGGCLTYSQAM
jgi:hypothetical protein